MHYMVALRSGIDVDVLSREFAQQFVNASEDAGCVCMQFTCDFINDTLLAIGLRCKITPDHIEPGHTSYPWDKEQLRAYIFQINEQEFQKVEQFLVSMSCAIASINPECYADTIATSDDGVRDHETPVEYFMKMIAAWCTVYRHLLDAGNLGTSNMFVEPLARINLQLFTGMHFLRLEYIRYFALLDNICSRLLKSAVQGVRYPMTCEVTLQTLLKIVSHDFYLIPEDAGFFLYEGLMVMCDSQTQLHILQELRTMVEENDGKRLDILTNILLSPKLMAFYYHVMVAKKGKLILKQQEEILQFLNSLQSKLLAVDCFSRKFIDSILNLVLCKRSNIASLACKLYTDIMRRKLTDELILVHFLSFYLSHVVNLLHLNAFVSQFYCHFEYIRDIYVFLDIVQWRNTSENMRLLCAHIAIEIFKIKFKSNDSSPNDRDDIESLLLILPQILEKLSCQPAIGILLQLFQFVSLDVLQKQTIDNVIQYAIDTFTNLDNSFEYPLLMNIFITLDKYLRVAQEWHRLELMGNFLMDECRRSLKKLRCLQLENKKRELNSCSTWLCCILKRVNIIIKAEYDIFNYLPEFLNTLENTVLTSYSVNYIGPDILNPASTFIDIYALELVISSIIKLSKGETNESISTTLAFRRAQEISEHLAKFVKDVKGFLKLPIFRMKAYFCSLLHLYCHMPIKMSTDTYYHMIHILIALNLAPTSSYDPGVTIEELQHTHPIQSNKYVSVMFRHFTELHKYDRIEIKSNVIWKLCLHFGRIESKFNGELKDLLITLATHRFIIFKHIIAVMVYNLHRQQPPLSSLTITLLLRKHKHLIDSELPADSSNLLKVHIVLMVLEIVEKSLGLQSINESFNRLESLKQLKIFTEDLGQSSQSAHKLLAKQLLEQQIHRLTKYILSAMELNELNNFNLAVQNI